MVISGTATDNIAVQTVEVRLDNGPWATATGTTSWSYSLNTSNLLNGPHVVAARLAIERALANEFVPLA